MNTCSICNGPLVLLGTLGSLVWFRCQDCGMEFCEQAACDDEEWQPDEEDE